MRSCSTDLRTLQKTNSWSSPAYMFGDKIEIVFVVMTWCIVWFIKDKMNNKDKMTLVQQGQDDTVEIVQNCYVVLPCWLIRKDLKNKKLTCSKSWKCSHAYACGTQVIPNVKICVFDCENISISTIKNVDNLSEWIPLSTDMITEFFLDCSSDRFFLNRHLLFRRTNYQGWKK
jgi:hypothetical protein